jgi:hypothetical protein
MRLRTRHRHCCKRRGPSRRPRREGRPFIGDPTSQTAAPDSAGCASARKPCPRYSSIVRSCEGLTTCKREEHMSLCSDIEPASPAAALATSRAGSVVYLTGCRAEMREQASVAFQRAHRVHPAELFPFVGTSQRVRASCRAHSVVCCECPRPDQKIHASERRAGWAHTAPRSCADVTRRSRLRHTSWCAARRLSNAQAGQHARGSRGWVGNECGRLSAVLASILAAKRAYKGLMQGLWGGRSSIQHS